MAAYADADDLIARYDPRLLGDLVRDDSHREAESDLSGNDKITTALEGASGEVNSYALRGGRYSVTDLTGLTGNDLEFLKDIVCILAIMRLHRRRSWVDLSDSVKDTAERAEKMLKALGDGTAIFNVSDVIDAGVGEVTAVSRVTVDREWELLVDKCRGQFYPRRRSYRNG